MVAVLEYDAVFCGGYVVTCWRNLLNLSSGKSHMVRKKSRYVWKEREECKRLLWLATLLSLTVRRATVGSAVVLILDLITVTGIIKPGKCPFPVILVQSSLQRIVPKLLFLI